MSWGDGDISDCGMFGDEECGDRGVAELRIRGGTRVGGTVMLLGCVGGTVCVDGGGASRSFVTALQNRNRR